MCHLDANYAQGEKAWRQLHKDATSYIKQILEATSHENSGYTATFHPSRGLIKLDEQGMRNTCLWTPLHWWASVGLPARTYLQQICRNTGCRLEELSEVMDGWDRWRERGKSVWEAWHDNNKDIYIYIYITVFYILSFATIYHGLQTVHIMILCLKYLILFWNHNVSSTAVRDC